ncbi:MAG: hypothetical protein ACXABY_07340 [Candidatus Thorarchaeota archaeon]|jgi:hypothetical protein
MKQRLDDMGFNYKTGKFTRIATDVAKIDYKFKYNEGKGLTFKQTKAKGDRKRVIQNKYLTVNRSKREWGKALLDDSDYNKGSYELPPKYRDKGEDEYKALRGKTDDVASGGDYGKPLPTPKEQGGVEPQLLRSDIEGPMARRKVLKQYGISNEEYQKKYNLDDDWNPKDTPDVITKDDITNLGKTDSTPTEPPNTSTPLITPDDMEKIKATPEKKEEGKVSVKPDVVNKITPDDIAAMEEAGLADTPVTEMADRIALDTKEDVSGMSDEEIVRKYGTDEQKAKAFPPMTREDKPPVGTKLETPTTSVVTGEAMKQPPVTRPAVQPLGVRTQQPEIKLEETVDTKGKPLPTTQKQPIASAIKAAEVPDDVPFDSGDELWDVGKAYIKDAIENVGLSEEEAYKAWNEKGYPEWKRNNPKDSNVVKATILPYPGDSIEVTALDSEAEKSLTKPGDVVPQGEDLSGKSPESLAPETVYPEIETTSHLKDDTQGIGLQMNEEGSTKQSTFSFFPESTGDIEDFMNRNVPLTKKSDQWTTNEDGQLVQEDVTFDDIDRRKQIQEAIINSPNYKHALATGAIKEVDPDGKFGAITLEGFKAAFPKGTLTEERGPQGVGFGANIDRFASLLDKDQEEVAITRRAQQVLPVNEENVPHLDMKNTQDVTINLEESSNEANKELLLQDLESLYGVSPKKNEERELLYSKADNYFKSIRGRAIGSEIQARFAQETAPIAPTQMSASLIPKNNAHFEALHGKRRSMIAGAKRSARGQVSNISDYNTAMDIINKQDLDSMDKIEAASLQAENQRVAKNIGTTNQTRQANSQLVNKFRMYNAEARAKDADRRQKSIDRSRDVYDQAMKDEVQFDIQKEGLRNYESALEKQKLSDPNKYTEFQMRMGALQQKHGFSKHMDQNETYGLWDNIRKKRSEAISGGEAFDLTPDDIDPYGLNKIPDTPTPVEENKNPFGIVSPELQYYKNRFK